MKKYITEKRIVETVIVFSATVRLLGKQVRNESAALEVVKSGKTPDEKFLPRIQFTNELILILNEIAKNKFFLSYHNKIPLIMDDAANKEILKKMGNSQSLDYYLFAVQNVSLDMLAAIASKLRKELAKDKRREKSLRRILTESGVSINSHEPYEPMDEIELPEEIQILKSALGMILKIRAVQPLEYFQEMHRYK